MQEQFGYQAFTVAHYRRFALELATLADQTDQGMRLVQALVESLRKDRVGRWSLDDMELITI